MKNRVVRSALYMFGALLALPIVADIATPINIHGQLLSSTGEPVSGTRAFVVSFFDAATNGNALGLAITDTVEVSADGLFNLTVQPPFEIFTVEEVWYALGVDTDEPADNDASDDIFPSRIRVHYVPLAVQAHRALSVDADGVGMGTVDDTELDMLNDVTSNVQAQIDAIDTAAITQHTTDIATNTTNIATNTADIATNTADIATNTADIATNTADIATNTADIATNTADIADNTSAIATNTTNIATNTADIADNTSAIATNTTNIATNTSDIADNTSAIATNTSDIADNTSAIATNTTDIATNTSAIALKANSADVYTQSAADAKFVELAGDNMSGVLGVNTIAEATASSGVTIEGVKLQDNYVELANIVAPGVTTGKLYRTGADLFWNGSQINGGGGDTDTLHWTAGYVYDFGPALPVFQQVMTKSGTITSFQMFCGSNANGTTMDFKINGASILTSSPAAFTGASLITPALSTTDFTAGDILELEIDGTTSDANGLTVTIIVEY